MLSHQFQATAGTARKCDLHLEIGVEQLVTEDNPAAGEPIVFAAQAQISQVNFTLDIGVAGWSEKFQRPIRRTLNAERLEFNIA
jgi:hypothetical protein